MSTKRRLLYNTITGFALQITSVLCGIILPRLIIGEYGSDANGLVQSITRFLSIVSFMEMGVGYVIQSSLYKPLAENDKIKQSEIMASGGKFFSRIGRILIIYVVVLIIVFPHINKSTFSWLYTATLILAISISSFAQYYFGIVDRLLLTADQRGYIQYSAQIITLIFNTIMCVILIKLDASIQVVKLFASIVFLIRPICIRIYINKKYKIDRKIKYNTDPITHKMSGLAMHISQVILEDTDTIVLTVLSTLANVSIYSVYHLIVYGVKQIIFSMTSGFDSILGRLWAKQELEKLRKFFASMEWLIHTLTTLIFSVCAVLIIPFVRVYTKGVTDAEYVQPLFAIIIVIATAGHCLRLPYNKMIIAGGHFKETQTCYIVSAILNIVISCVTVFFWGLIGVAIGTLISMFYQTVWMAFYDSKNFLKISLLIFFKQMSVDVISFILVIVTTKWISIGYIDYLSWVILAVKVFLIALIEIIIINLLLYRNHFGDLKELLNVKFKKKSKTE